MLLLSFLVAAALAPQLRAIQLVSLPPISSSPVGASQVVDRALASLSIEPAYLTSYGGNNSSPNVLTRALMQHLESRTGVGPDLRPGGITIDSSIFNPDGPALVLTESSAGGVYRTNFGPAYYESLNVFPNSTMFVINVNLGNETIKIARDELAAALEYIGWDRIRAFELGNEADHYAGGSRPAGWASADYTAEFLGWTAVLTHNLSLPRAIFQAGSFADDPVPGAAMTTVDLINEGVDTTGVIKLFNQHMYQYSTCDPVRNALATLPNLVNHTNITSYVNLWNPQIAAAHRQGKEFVVGEYNSVSCSGKENVTNTFGQALWLADTVLYSASVNISRMYLHQGATLVLQSGTQANTPGFSWYDLWYPVDTERYGVARASPSFVAYLFIAETIGRSGTSRISLVPITQQPDIALYAIWDAQHLGRLAILNMAHRDVSTTADEAAALAVSLDLSGVIAAAGVPATGVTLKRITAPGMDETDSTSTVWAGQSYADGSANGVEVTEYLNGNAVEVGASEGVLVFLRASS
ncbi:glycoside hydrolase family 79 protein [Auriscalpium vulgare]|uniref:Glycoside hydrolase family 79 protein n=1 Tax=Auriscalpium vulgare TaxID=40419 RepID=A0ACB8S032_9AGAM|nr:glycoside hydrolase family 79 protein [Auriscalpium vulgare]